MTGIGDGPGKAFVTILLWIATAIAINTSITVWIITVHGNGEHSGSMPAIVFSEYRTAQQWRYDYLAKEIVDRHRRFEEALESIEHRLDSVERAMYAHEARNSENKNLMPPKEEHKKFNFPDWYPGE